MRLCGFCCSNGLIYRYCYHAAVALLNYFDCCGHVHLRVASHSCVAFSMIISLQNCPALARYGRRHLPYDWIGSCFPCCGVVCALSAWPSLNLSYWRDCDGGDGDDAGGSAVTMAANDCVDSAAGASTKSGLTSLPASSLSL